MVMAGRIAHEEFEYRSIAALARSIRCEPSYAFNADK